MPYALLLSLVLAPSSPPQEPAAVRPPEGPESPVAAAPAVPDPAPPPAPPAPEPAPEADAESAGEPAPAEPGPLAVFRAADEVQEPFRSAPEPEEERPWYESVNLGLTLDLITELSEVEESHNRFNTARARSVQFQADSVLEDFGRAYATLDVSDGGDGSDLILREAAIWIDYLPGNFTFRTGKYFSDLGAWNGVLPSEFPAPNLDGVRKEYLGGNLSASGCELHHYFDFGADRLRWSVGIATDLQGQDLDAPGNGLQDPEFGTQPFGRRGIANWAGTARVAWMREFSSHSRGTLGGSFLYTPERTTFTFVNPDGVLGTADDQTLRDELRQALVGMDLSLQYDDPDGSGWDRFAVEVWHDNSQFRSPSSGALKMDGSTGYWGLYEHAFDDFWSAGALSSWYQRRGLDMQDEGSHYSAFVAYRFTEKNRVNLFFTHTNPGFGIEKFFTVGAQWVVDLGAPRRAAALRWGPPPAPAGRPD